MTVRFHESREFLDQVNNCELLKRILYLEVIIYFHLHVRFEVMSITLNSRLHFGVMVKMCVNFK
jgi:hypothetical protein